MISDPKALLQFQGAQKYVMKNFQTSIEKQMQTLE